jgi:hypothetical protein
MIDVLVRWTLACERCGIPHDDRIEAAIRFDEAIEAPPNKVVLALVLLLLEMAKEDTTEIFEDWQIEPMRFVRALQAARLIRGSDESEER